MDSYREFPSEFEPAHAVETPQDTTAEIGTDERRMHVRAYNYWVSLLDGRDYPSVEDLEPADQTEFAPHSVLLDFTAGPDNPAMPYIGAAIREECGIEEDVQTISAVPSRSLLSRLTDHYMQIIANRAPVGFEAEFVNQRGDSLCYRGIMMPFSSDGETIDFIYGVINWKAVGQPIETAALVPALDPAGDEPLELTEVIAPAALTLEPEPAPELIEIGDDAALADRLWAARECAEAAKAAEGRSRDSLYQALSVAYDFALAGKESPDEFAELLEDSGVKPQARAPMTAVVKLIFGVDYDKARLTEYAAALSFAERSAVEPGGFLDFIRFQAGGLKALVAAERTVRRPGPKTDTSTEKARERLRIAKALKLNEIAGEEEFALVLTRRATGGGHEPVALIDDPALVERAIRTAAR